MAEESRVMLNKLASSGPPPRNSRINSGGVCVKSSKGQAQREVAHLCGEHALLERIQLYRDDFAS